MSTPMRRTSPKQFVEVRAERLEGAPVGERRRWSDAFKDRAIAASLEPGVNISALARSLEITPSQLFSWRGVAAKGQRRASVGRLGKLERSEGAAGGDRGRRRGAARAADIAEDDLRRLVRAVREA